MRHIRGLIQAAVRALRGCPRERLGYRCHADYPGGCEGCGRVAPVRADLRAPDLRQPHEAGHGQ
ncbi:hypothetical protein PSD17_38970 [Pseudonocardia sp. D17]|nr:hypothetical protein PSD17_38970 [Pseudonocardia sp. D17]